MFNMTYFRIKLDLCMYVLKWFLFINCNNLLCMHSNNNSGIIFFFLHQILATTLKIWDIINMGYSIINS